MNTAGKAAPQRTIGPIAAMLNNDPAASTAAAPIGARRHHATGTVIDNTHTAPIARWAAPTPGLPTTATIAATLSRSATQRSSTGSPKAVRYAHDRTRLLGSIRTIMPPFRL